MKTIRFFNIAWDTDGEAPLPSEFIVHGISDDADMDDEGAEYISEATGFLVDSFSWERILPEFTCGKCGGHRLEEVMENATVSTEIVGVGPGGDIEYGRMSTEDGDVTRYQCLTCGEDVGPTNSEELAEYLGIKE